MQLLKIHYKPSKTVKTYADIKDEAEKLKSFIVNHRFVGKHSGAYAIHHAQVSENPFNFFVVHPKYIVGDKPLFSDRVIINPKITKVVPIKKGEFEQYFREDTPDNRKIYSRMPDSVESAMLNEGCMSFPYKEFKKVKRYLQIEVSYQNEKMETVTKFLVDVPAQIFQHEIDHGFGKNIYYNGYN